MRIIDAATLVFFVGSASFALASLRHNLADLWSVITTKDHDNGEA